MVLTIEQEIAKGKSVAVMDVEETEVVQTVGMEIMVQKEKTNILENGKKRGCNVQNWF